MAGDRTYTATRADGSWVVQRGNGEYLMGPKEWTTDLLLAKPFVNRGEALIEGFLNDSPSEFFDEND